MKQHLPGKHLFRVRNQAPKLYIDSYDSKTSSRHLLLILGHGGMEISATTLTRNDPQVEEKTALKATTRCLLG